MTQVEASGTTNYAFNKANALTLLTPPTGQPTTFSYDANGNLTLENAGGSLTTYTWDSENRLLNVNAASGIETNTYAITGLRQSKQVQTGGVVTLTHFLWDNQNVQNEVE